jgi:hypothetical protein
MKKLLFLLMMVASVASAHPRSDAELKALISDGVWNYDVGRKSGYVAFRPDGVLLTDGEGLMKWDIKDGVLDEIDTPETEGVDRDKWQGKSAGYWYNYTILFLTKHELLLQDTKDKSIYQFMSR